MQSYERFEEAWARMNYTDPGNMVACSSGGAALHLALETLVTRFSYDRKDWKIIIPDYTMVAVARAVSMAGFTPVFVDCDESLMMDLHSLEASGYLSDKWVLGIIAVHNYGRAVDMAHLHRLAKQYAIPYVIEDLAEAHGLMPHSDTTAATWSFYKNKIVAGEEGGAISFTRPYHAELARSLRSYGFTPEHDFHHMPRGWNYRLANALADLILADIDLYEQKVGQRWCVYRTLDSLVPYDWRMLSNRVAPWVYDFRIRGLTREQQAAIVTYLQKDLGIAARHGFKPLSKQEEYFGHPLIKRNPATQSIACQLMHEIIYLPLDKPITVNPFRGIENVISKT